MDPLLAALTGAGYAQLPAAVRALHASNGPQRWQGQCRIQTGSHPLARLCAWVASLPPAGEQVATTVQITRSPEQEVWQRDFAGAAMCSRLWRGPAGLRERLGPVQLDFQLQADSLGLAWQGRGLRLLGWLPLPSRWCHGVRCLESQDAQGRYTFQVEASLPLIGTLVRYEGWMLPAG